MARLKEVPVHVHCIANYRVSAFFYRYRRDVLGMDETQARSDMEQIWHPEGVWAAFVVAKLLRRNFRWPSHELRTYTLRVGAMAEAVKLYQEFGFPALQRGGQDKKLVGYFQADTGMINQLVHLWKFDDDADRRAHWQAVYANKDFVEGFASKFRPLLNPQVKLLRRLPGGPPPLSSAGGGGAERGCPASTGGAD